MKEKREDRRLKRDGMMGNGKYEYEYTPAELGTGGGGCQYTVLRTVVRIPDYYYEGRDSRSTRNKKKPWGAKHRGSQAKGRATPTPNFHTPSLFFKHTHGPSRAIITTGSQ